MKTHIFYRTLALLTIAAAHGACWPEVHDKGSVCLAPSGDVLLVEAFSEESCARDHRGARLSCTALQAEDGVIEIGTTFRDGRDPDSACPGRLTATCELRGLAAGSYEVRFGELVETLDFPGDAPTCLGGACDGRCRGT